MFTMLKYAPYIFREAFAKVGRFNLWEDNFNNAHCWLESNSKIVSISRSELICV